MVNLQKPDKPLQTILIKPSGGTCNMECEYCFYNKNSCANRSTHMPIEILEEITKQAAEQSDQVSFVWQGGEPAMTGLSFFEKAVKLQKKYMPAPPGNGFQTNGTLIDDKWANLFKRNYFLIGLSIDGPEHIHDRYRRLKNGMGSWSIVYNNLKLLLDRGVDVNSVSVVNDYSSKHPDEIYSFLKDAGIRYMQFIPCVERDPANPKRLTDFSLSAQQYGDFLCRLFDLWVSDFQRGIPVISIRNFDSVLHTYLGMEPPDCNFTKECGAYLTIESSGDVYSCDFFVEESWKLGHILETPLIEMLNSPKQKRFGQIKSTLPDECDRCSWLKICRGGCIKDRIRSKRDNSNHFCGAYKMFFKHAHLRFRELAVKISELNR